ncbi:uncharacterized protein LOC129228201 [Uloborus diversus]|uniref:uncharacterized protein LOC129228201 n=1 Tax=Uloborus diversus TaxID=327109 RepID=UPI002409018E|nr:uncharacterized protein LOC129228201 [Uloborus diversus]
MDFKPVLALEYSAQHFGFHPRTFLDNLYNVYFENICEALTNLNGILSEEFRELVPAYQIQFSTDALLEDFVKNLDKYFDLFEIYLNKNVLSIPKDVLLSVDEIQMQVNCSKQAEENLDTEIKKLRRKIIEEKKKKAVFEAKIKEQHLVKDYLYDINASIQSILNSLLPDDNLSEVMRNNKRRCAELLKKHKKIKIEGEQSIKKLNFNNYISSGNMPLKSHSLKEGKQK